MTDKMKKLAAFFGILILFSSCQGIQKSDEPEDLIPEDKMVEVLTDISLLQGARSYNKELMNQKGINVEKYVFEKYDIDSLQYIRSNRYYSENYKEYEDIYSKVKVRLESLKVEYDSIREQEEKRQDSLRALDKKDTLDPGRLRDLRDSLKLKRIKRRDSLINPISKIDTLAS